MTIVEEKVVHDPYLLAEYLKNTSRITWMQATPSIWKMLLESGWKNPHNIKCISGGEVLSSDLASNLIRNSGGLWNIYGPTETTIWATVKKVTAPINTVSIGHPLEGVSCFVVDNGRIVDVKDHVGELYIGGVGLALGYWNNKQETTKKFFTDNVFNGVRVIS